MRKLLVCAMCMLMLLALGCAGESKRTANNNAKAQKVVHLAAAASLEKVFEQQLIPMFTKKHPHLKIQGIYDASGKLQSQIENGLSADIFISAATKQMQALDKKGYLDSASIKPLLENKLVLIVPAKGASDIKEFKDIAKAKHPAIGDPASLSVLWKDMKSKDWFMALLDLKAYIAVKDALLARYEDRAAWARMSLVNIAKAGYFSSDRTIAQYNRDIWHL